MKTMRVWILAAPVVIWPALCFAGAAEVAACRTIKDDTQRLACFDKTVPGLVSDIEATRPTPVSRFGQVAQPAVTEKEFGRENNPAIPAEVPPVTNMADTLQRLEMRDGKPVFYFTNGQVWAAQERRMVTLKGDGADHAVVKRSLVGYLITVNDSSAQISVVRVK